MEEKQPGIGKKIWKVTKVTLLSLSLFVIFVVALLYVPFVQDFIVPRVLNAINSDDLTVKVEHFRLKFPLNVDVRGIELMQKGDTMLVAADARVSVSFFPLLTGNVNAGDIELRDVYYKLGTPDSASYIRARVDSVTINDVAVGLKKQSVAVDKLILSRGNIRIELRNDSTPEPPSPSTPAYWNIAGADIALNNIDFEMITVETGDTISANLNNFKMLNGVVDLGKHNVTVDDVSINGVAGRYIVGGNIVSSYSDSLATDYILPPDTLEPDTIPWSVTVGHIKLDKGDMLYAAAGVVPQPGFDTRYIDVNSVVVEVDSFYNCGTEMRVPIKELTATERSGLRIVGDGFFGMDSVGIKVKDFNLRTLASTIAVDAEYGLATENAPLSVALSADIEPIDVVTAFPSLQSTIAMLPKHRKIEVDVNASGSVADLHIDSVDVAMRNYFDVRLAGDVKNAMDFNNADGHLDITGDFNDINFVRPTPTEAKLGRTTKMPPLTLSGAVDIASGTIKSKLKAVTQAGDLAFDGKCNLRAEGYEMALNADGFPVGAFLPGLEVGNVTANVNLSGRGVDLMNRRTQLTAKVDAIDVGYRRHSLHDMKIVAAIADGMADLNITSSNDVIDGNIIASGNLVGENYEWSLIGDLSNVDLKALGVLDTVSNVSVSMAANVNMSTVSNDLSAALDLHQVKAVMGTKSYGVKDFNIDFVGSDSTSQLFVDNQDMKLKFISPMLIDSVASRFASAMELIGPMIDSCDIQVDALQRRLPEFTLDVEAGTRNALHNYLMSSSGIEFRKLNLSAGNDNLIRIDADVEGFASGATRFDNLTFAAIQEGGRLNYDLKIDNEPGTLDDFAHVTGSGYVGGDCVKLSLNQRNINDETGYRIGALVEFSDSTLKLKLDPTDPIIGYRQWQVNADNGISINTKNYCLDANLLMTNNDSRLHIYTEHDSIHSDHSTEKVNVDISKIQLAEWISLSPYASPMKGELSANLEFAMSPGQLNGTGEVTLADFTYAKRRVGTLDLNLDVMTSRSGVMTARTGLKVDGREVMTATGALNDTTHSDPFKLDFKLTRLPMALANPFMGKTATFAGYMNGDMDITGSMAEPKFNGYIDFDSATVRLAMLGTAFNFSDEKIPVDSNIVRFDRYAIHGVNGNPLEITGQVDLRSLSDVNFDINLLADNMQIVGNEKRRGTDVYGKAFVSVDANARGDMNFVNARAKLTVKEGTNVTYIMPEASTRLASQSTGDMVRFVNFSDTTLSIVGDTVPSLETIMNLNATLNVEEGAVIGVDLSANGQDRVQVQSNGSIDFSINPLGDTRAVGRLNITDGYVRYSPPLMSEKMFKFNEDSYVALNGNIDNPILNVSAVDVVKANVTQEGQNSRLINFDVILRVNGTLEDMEVVFDLNTNEDVTVSNELQSMTPEQRANQAMNLLLYNIYTGPGTKGNANIAGNPLYSFLSSQLNTWMANNVKVVDVTVGIDQYERTFEGASSTTTNYSYQVSKSFLDDRFKVVIGGNYSTDVDADENVSQNLINDISVEYLLNKSGTMYVKLFRHTGYESILEGEVTQTGVGFIYRRKLRALRQIFDRNRKLDQSKLQDEALRMVGDILRSVNKKEKADETISE